MRARAASRGHRDAPVLVVDLGAQYAQLIARRVREAHVYSEIVPHTMAIEEMLAKRPGAIILSGGPASIYEPDAPAVDRRLFEVGVPVLGLCYGYHAMADALGGTVKRTECAEFGRTDATLDPTAVLFEGLEPRQSVWMSHRDAVVVPPVGFRVTAATSSCEIAAFEDPRRGLFGLQWHPEVRHTDRGEEMLERFLFGAAGLAPGWTPSSIVSDAIAEIAETVGEHHAICGLSGGVDSAVAAALVHRAIGDRLTCVFVDHGLLRQGEREQVEKDYVAATGIRLHTVDASARFLDALAGVVDPEGKRKVVGREFIRTFEEAAAAVISGEQHESSVEFLVQGTLYPDVVESGGGSGTQVIKSHHNVGGLPEDLSFRLVEPLRSLFKDEVRQIGLELGLPEEIVWRHPFPGPGLSIRIVGEVTAERLDTLRRADAIVREEVRRAGLERDIWQFPVVLLGDIRSVGVQGDTRSYGYPIVLRPVTSEDAMTADWARLPHELLEALSTRITNEVDGVNRVVLDVTSKPPASIEWE